jgi:anti-sigma-K factor RskA
MGPGGDKPAGMLPDPRHGMTGPVVASGLNPDDRLGLTVEPAGGSTHPTSAVIMFMPL